MSTCTALVPVIKFPPDVPEKWELLNGVAKRAPLDTFSFQQRDLLISAWRKYPDIRTMIICSYQLGNTYYAEDDGDFLTDDWANERPVERESYKYSAAARIRTLGSLLMYPIDNPDIDPPEKGYKDMDVELMVERWKNVIIDLAVAHDKDASDLAEASIETCLTPILSAPVSQLREFAPKLLAALKADQRCPFLVWRAYERWIETVIVKETDEAVKELKVGLAREITDLIEEDLKPQLPEAVVRALMWRSPAQLERTKDVVSREKEAGNKVRLRGRESCLFIEAGGTEEKPEICIQV